MLLSLFARTSHDKPTWRAAASHADLQARRPDAPLPVAVLPETVPKDSTVIVEFVALGSAWGEPAVSVAAPRQRRTLGNLDVVLDDDVAVLHLPDGGVARSAHGVPRRPRLDLGTVAPGQAAIVHVNWRTNSTSGSHYVDTTTVIAWPTDDPAGRTAHDVLADLTIRTVDLRAVLR